MTTRQKNIEKEDGIVTQEKLDLDALLPLCESNRNLVVTPATYVHNAVFAVGPLKFIDKAP